MIRNNVFSVSIIVGSNCHILQFLHQMFNVPMTLSYPYQSLLSAVNKAVEWSTFVDLTIISVGLIVCRICYVNSPIQIIRVWLKL